MLVHLLHTLTLPMVEHPYIFKLVKGVVRLSLLSQCQLRLLSHEKLMFCRALSSRT
jgi:hypothetical protein